MATDGHRAPIARALQCVEDSRHRHAHRTSFNGIARGEAQLSTVVSYSVDALGNPFVGVLLGLVCAAGLFVASRSSFALVQPDDASAGLALVAMSLFARLIAATAVLWAYKHFAPLGFKPFALSLAGGFLVLYTVELVRYAGLHRYRRPAGARQ